MSAVVLGHRTQPVGVFTFCDLYVQNTPLLISGVAGSNDTAGYVTVMLHVSV